MDQKVYQQPLRSIEPLLLSTSEPPRSPISPSFNSPAFQDLIARQPTHPDGPQAGWDMGLNLLGDPPTTAEYKTIQEGAVKTNLRRLHSTAVAFELFLGLWGGYTLVRYWLAFVTTSDHVQRVGALVLGIASAVAVASNIAATISPLFHDYAPVHSLSRARSLLRACYLLLILLTSTANLAFVAIWHPNNRCKWDIDILWYISSLNTPSTPCRPVSFTVWIIAAVLRLLVTSTVTALFIRAIHTYQTTRHPSQTQFPRKRPSYQPTTSHSDPEETSPTDTSTPSTSTSKNPLSFSTFVRSGRKQIGRSSSTLAPSNSSSTLVPSSSHTAQSSPPKATKSVGPPTYRPTPGSLANGSIFFNGHMKTSGFNFGHTSPGRTGTGDAHGWTYGDTINVEMVSHTVCQTQQPNEAAPPKHRTLRRTSRLSGWQDPPVPRPAEKPAVKGPTSSRPKTAHHVLERSAVEPNDPRGYDSELNSISDGSHDHPGEYDGPSYAYGYGAPGPSYPYLDLYNPRPSTLHSSLPSLSSTETMHEASVSSHNSGSDVSDSDDEREEYVPIMGGYIRRMTTIESMGSREVSTLDGTTSWRWSHGVVSTRDSMSATSSISPSMMSGSVSSMNMAHGGRLLPVHTPMRFGRTSPSSFASTAPSVWADVSSVAGVSATDSGNSRSTTYLSMSSGNDGGRGGTVGERERNARKGNRIRVTERGELLPPETRPTSRTSSLASHGRHYWTASSNQSGSSGCSLPTTAEEY